MRYRELVSELPSEIGPLAQGFFDFHALNLFCDYLVMLAPYFISKQEQNTAVEGWNEQISQLTSERDQLKDSLEEVTKVIAISNYDDLFSVYFSIGNLLTTFVKKSLAEIQFFLKTLYNSLAVVGAKIIWSVKLCPPSVQNLVYHSFH